MSFMQANFDIHHLHLLPNTLTIGVTQSGETADTIAAIDMEIKRRSSIEDKNLNQSYCNNK